MTTTRAFNTLCFAVFALITTITLAVVVFW